MAKKEGRTRPDRRATTIGSNPLWASAGGRHARMAPLRHGIGVLTCGPEAIVSGNSNRFEYFQIHSKFHLSKLGLPELKIFEIKYGFEGFEERNNFLYRNFFKFEVDFE
jgi:hypothetical protein